MTKKELTELIDILSEKLTQAVKELDLIKAKQEPTPKQDSELYKWYPIVDEGEYWTEYDTANVLFPNLNKVQTIVTNGARIYTYRECNLGWSTMAKSGDWKYMRIKID